MHATKICQHLPQELLLKLQQILFGRTSALSMERMPSSSVLHFRVSPENKVKCVAGFMFSQKPPGTATAGTAAREGWRQHRQLLLRGRVPFRLRNANLNLYEQQNLQTESISHRMKTIRQNRAE